MLMTNALLQGTWTSLGGEEVVDYLGPITYLSHRDTSRLDRPDFCRYTNNTGSGPLLYTETATWKQRQQFGVKLAFTRSGAFGFFDYGYFVNVVLQGSNLPLQAPSMRLSPAVATGVILLGISVEITKQVARNCVHYDGTSQIFSNYQNTLISCPRATARTAALAALQCHQFFEVTNGVTRMSMPGLISASWKGTAWI
jgi:hypothetical protein